MSKLFPKLFPPDTDPVAQLDYFAKRVASMVTPGSRERVQERTAALGFDLTAQEVQIIAALDNPRRVQWFLNEELYYNSDSETDELEETCYSPRMVLRMGRAHCFEGALFAYMVNYINEFNPRWMLLEGTRDVDHNIIVYYDKHPGRWGCNAQSGYPHLNGREPEFATLRELAETYAPHYYSGYTNDPADLTLVGFSEPMDITERFGTDWMGSLEPPWDIYYLLVDDSWTFYRMTPPFGAQYRDEGETHEYMLHRALKCKWIECKPHPFVNVNHLPPRAQAIWQEFWELFDPDGFLPRGRAAALEGEFFKVTGMTPLDLNFNLEELELFLERGYKLEQLFRR